MNVAGKESLFSQTRPHTPGRYPCCGFARAKRQAFTTGDFWKQPPAKFGIGGGQWTCWRFGNPILRLDNSASSLLSEKTRNWSFQGFRNCGDFVVHKVACLILYAGNGCLIHYDPSHRQSCSQIFLRNGRVAFQTCFPNPISNQISCCIFARFLHSM